MRHGAGPLSYSHEIKAEAPNNLSAEIGAVSLKDDTKEQRLGCYFCNDVVAPVDVSFFTENDSLILVVHSFNEN